MVIPSRCGMFVYRLVTFIETNMALYFRQFNPLDEVNKVCRKLVVVLLAE